MKEDKNWQTSSWFAVVLVSLIVGQILLARAAAGTTFENPPWAAVAVIVIGAIILWIVRSYVPQKEARPYNQQNGQSSGYEESSPQFSDLYLKRLSWRSVFVLIAVLLTLFVLWRIPGMGPHDDYVLVAAAWFAAILFYLLAFAEPFEDQNWGTWLRNRSWKLIIGVVGIIAMAFVLRIWRLGSIPYTLSGDEASQGLEAVRVLMRDIRNPFSTGWLGVPTMSFFFNSLSLKFLGRTIFALRLPWVFVGTLTILVTFLLVRRLMGTGLALVTAVLLATYHYHIHYSRLGSNQIADPLFLALALFFMVRALDHKRCLDWALAEMVCGFAFYVYAGARLTPVVLVAVLAYWFLLNPRNFWRDHKWGLLVGFVAFLIVAAPMIQYAIRFPVEFNARLYQVGIIQSGWLEREVVILDQPAWKILFDQFRRAALAFNYYPDRTVWYGLPAPLLDPFFGGIFLLGLVYSTLQLFNRRVGPRIAPMVAWWWGGMILGGIMTESPPSSQRLITLAVPACFFIAYALWELVQLAGQSIKSAPARALIVLGVLFFALISLNSYFIQYTPQQLYGGRNAEMATAIAPRLNELKAEHRIYFVGAPWMYWGFATLPYLVPDADAGDILDPLTEPLPENLFVQDKGALFIVIPPRMEELDILARAFPNGVREDVSSPIDGRHMVTLFRIDP